MNISYNMIVNAFNLTLLLTVFIVVLNYVSGESFPKSSVVFVIDKTNSMGNVIDAVKAGANAIFDTVTTSDDPSIENFILVTFGDPHVSDAIITSNPDEFMKALSSITLEDGGDCAEMSLTGIKKGLEASLPSSNIYVFTDAPSKDHKLYSEVKKTAQDKDSQMVFILTKGCTSDNSTLDSVSDSALAKNGAVDEVYTKLANATSEQVFSLLDQYIGEILQYVQDSIGARRVILQARRYPAGGHTVGFVSDTRTTDMTIAISGSYPEATVYGPGGEPLDADALVTLNNVLILKVDDDESKPGVHSVKLHSSAPSNIVISARSDIKFRHGFSTTIPSSFNDAVFKPISTAENYLLIKLYGDEVKLTSVKFLNTNYAKLLEIPLKEINEKEQIYVTNLLNPPKTTFRIAVKGIDKVTNTIITRYGSMLLESERFVNKNPTVNIEGDKKVTVDYGGSLKLICKVNAYPEPRIAWKDKSTGKIISGVDSIREPPYDFTNILELGNLEKSTTYECFGTNRLGVGSTGVKVIVKQKPYFNLLERPTNIEVDYNSEAVLHCKVDAYPPAKITWFTYPWKKRFPKKGTYKTSPDGSILTINHLKPSNTGIYVCRAENINKLIFPRATISISAKIPKIDKTSSEIHVKEGYSADLSCSILEAKPAPEIKWFRRPAFDPMAKFMEMAEFRNQAFISMRNLNKYDTGIYKCRAYNIMGVDAHAIELFVECPPTIKDDTKFIVAKEGTEIKMSCIVQGVPTPKDVVWRKDGMPLGSEATVFRDHSVKFEVDLHHTGGYTCTAKNNLGSAQRKVDVVVYNLRINPPTKSKRPIKRGKKLTLPCSAHGEPKPTYKWMYYSFDKKVTKPVKTRITTLVFTKIKESQSGYYTCIASNIGESQNITYEVDVLFPPEIQSDLKPQYWAVEGDRVLRIHCRATGNPKPKINWQKNGLPIAKSDRFLIEYDRLIIMNIKKVDTEGDYYCEAQNEISWDTKTFEVIVDRYPPADLIINTTTILVKEGEDALVKCFIAHEDIDTIVWYRDRRMFHEGKLLLDKAKVTDSGMYTCRVNYQDSPDKDNANTEIIVGSEPTFVTEEETVVELEYGQFYFLNCKVLGDPSPTVTWRHNGNNMGFSDMVYNFNMDFTTAGKYVCELRNYFGKTSRTFDVTFKGCHPKLDAGIKNQPVLTTSGSWPTFKVIDGYTVMSEGQTIVLSCPNHFTKFDQTDVTAKCERGTKFTIDGMSVEYSDIQCNSEIKPRISRKRKLCYGKNTETIQLVFDINHKTIEVFEVCLDGHGNPIYAKHTMKSPAGYTPKDTSIFDNPNLDRFYNCHNQKVTFERIFRRPFLDRPNCCFAMRQLVNSKDVFPGPSQRATFSSLNIVPHWSSCRGENWDEVEDRIRELSRSTDNDLIIYTGTYGYVTSYNKYRIKEQLFLNRKTRQPIPEYFWKVVQNPTTKSSLAIIHLNIPEVSSSEVDDRVLCRDICKDIPWMKGPNWHTPEKGFTYCCELSDFERVFSYKGVFQPNFNNVLNA